MSASIQHTDRCTESRARRAFRGVRQAQRGIVVISWRYHQRDRAPCTRRSSSPQARRCLGRAYPLFHSRSHYQPRGPACLRSHMRVRDPCAPAPFGSMYLMYPPPACFPRAGAPRLSTRNRSSCRYISRCGGMVIVYLPDCPVSLPPASMPEIRCHNEESHDQSAMPAGRKETGGPNRTLGSEMSRWFPHRESSPFCWLTCPLRWTGARRENDSTPVPSPCPPFHRHRLSPAGQAWRADSQAEHEQPAAGRDGRPADLRVRQRISGDRDSTARTWAR